MIVAVTNNPDISVGNTLDSMDNLRIDINFARFV